MNMMIDFINNINNMNLMTEFIKNMFKNDNIFDYNYMFRFTTTDDEIIIDIYDNISDKKFNRYIYSFNIDNYNYKLEVEDRLYIHYINIFNIEDNDDNMLKLGYLFSLDNNKMIEYAKIFLNDEFVLILKDIIK